MKSAFALFVFSMAIIAHASDPRLKIDPAQPHPGGKLSISFDPKKGPLEHSEILNLVYGFEPFDNFHVQLHPQGDRYVADISIPATGAYFWCWIEGKTSEENDTNRGGVWDTYLYDDKGLPVENARRIRAFVYRMRHRAIDQNAVALTLLEEELRQFPANGLARGNWWGLRFEDEGSTNEAREQLLTEITTFLQANLDHPWAYHAAALGYNNLGRNTQAINVLRSFVKRFPEDSSIDTLVLTIYSNYGTQADLEDLQHLSPRWAKSKDYWSELFRTYASSHVSPEQLRNTGERLLELTPQDQDTFGETRASIAETWLANGVDPVAAERIAREAVKISELGERYTVPPNKLADKRLFTHSMYTEIHRSTLGWALYQQKRYNEARSELQKAVALRESEKILARTVYYRLGKTLEKLDRPNEAMSAYMQEIAWGSEKEQSRKAAALIYAKEHRSSEGFDAEVQSRVNDLVAAATVEAEDPIEEVNQKLGRFDLRKPNDLPISLSQYEGKVVLIEYWATWCHACLSSMENTQELERQFPGKIVVLAVCTDSEETRNQAQPYLTKKGYDFVLLFDDENRRDLAVPYVPARFLLDRTGRLRVKEFGVNPSLEFVFAKKLKSLVDEKISQ